MRHADRIPGSGMNMNDPGDVDRSLNIVDERLTMGGVRLAALLSHLLGE